MNISVAAKYRNWRLNTFSEKTKENIAPKTIREELMFIKNKIFERAIEDKIISENPFKRAMKDLRVYKKEVLPFTEEEVNLLIQNAPNDLHQDFYTVLHLTGSRFGEVANLEWDDIDFENKLLFICNKSFHKTKTRSERVIPLYSKLETIFLNRKQKIKSKFVFHSPKDNSKPIRTLLRKFTETKVKLNIDSRKTLHSFRHAFATHLRSKGVSLETIQELLGHSDIKETRHYQHMDLKVLKEAISKLQILS